MELLIVPATIPGGALVIVPFEWLAAAIARTDVM